MRALNVAMLGAIATACLGAAMFFLRFWQRGRDRFFLLLAASFFVEALNRAAPALSATPNDGAPIFYCVGLVSFVLIIVAIADKNRR